MRVLGAELVSRYPERYARGIGDDQARFREPCPVCGHPTGDCTGLHDQTQEARMAKEAAAKKAPAAKKQGTPPERPAAKKAAVPEGQPPARSEAASIGMRAGGESIQTENPRAKDGPSDAQRLGDKLGTAEERRPAGTGAPMGAVHNGGEKSPLNAPSPVEATDAAAFAKKEGATPKVADAVAATPAGAPNGNDEVAGGTHASSVANTEALAGDLTKPRAKAGKAPEGFEHVDGNENLLRATKDHQHTFTPRNTKRESTIQLWRKGQVVSRSAVEERLSLYEAGETK